MTETPQTSNALFVGKDAVVQAIYTRFLEVLRSLGPFQEEPKKTSIHLVRNPHEMPSEEVLSRSAPYHLAPGMTIMNSSLTQYRSIQTDPANR